MSADRPAAGEPRRLTDPHEGDWVIGGLLDHDRVHGCRAGSVVPTGFERVVRVLHPAGPGTWAQAAAATARTVHPLVQWPCIAAHFDGGGRGSDVDPEEGSVPVETLAAILDSCPGGGDLVQAVWEGFGSWHEPADPATLLDGWGGRSYRLFATPVEPITRWPGMDGSWPQSANLIWPRDRSWCLATDIDFDSTLVAGTAEICGAILADPRLEAFAVGYDDDLSWCGDTVNPRPGWLADLCTRG